MKTYEFIDNGEVLDQLSQKANLVCCDFKAMKIIECDVLTMGALASYIASNEASFFKVVENA